MRVAIRAGLAALGLAVSAHAAQAQYTWTQWTVGSGGNGHWYALTQEAVPFEDYIAEASMAGGYTASVLSGAENSFLFDTFTTGSVNTPSLWIGYARSGTSYASPCTTGATSFAWLSGEANGYENWNPGEPNYSSCDNVALFNNNGVAGWNDVPTVSGAYGTISAAGIIERNTDPNGAPGSVVPEPATLVLLGSGLLAVGGVARRRRAA